MQCTYYETAAGLWCKLLVLSSFWNKYYYICATLKQFEVLEFENKSLFGGHYEVSIFGDEV